MTNGRTHYRPLLNALSPTAIGVTTSTVAFSRLLESHAQAEGRCAVFDRALCAGGLAAPRVHTPHGRGNCRNRAMRRYLPFATISAEDVASPKSICEWAKSGQGRTFTNRQFCERASPMLDYFIATMACAENDILNVFGCGRLIAGIGFLRLPASSTSAQRES